MRGMGNEHREDAMNRRNILSLSSIAAAGLPRRHALQYGSKRQSKTSSWELGHSSRHLMCIPMAKRLTVGAQFRRRFSCLTHGHFAQFITRSDLPKFAAGTADKGTPDENKAVLSGFVASFGTYTVDEADKTVIT